LKREWNMDLADKRIVVLGGTSGIGFAVARKAATQGAAVVVASSREDSVNRARKLLSGAVEGVTIDLTNEANIKSFFAKISEFDHLVYTAGESLLSEPLATLSLESAKKFFDVRFWGAFLAVKYGVPKIRKGGDRAIVGHGFAAIPEGLERDIQRLRRGRSAHAIARSRIGAAAGQSCVSWLSENGVMGRHAGRGTPGDVSASRAESARRPRWRS
jgi:NAD(P)-dependent dehydrogenase (short-subunit alcohol dehydrogenase family)